MDRWALQYGDQCTFVIACCDGKQLAETFASELKLEHVVNVWLDRRSMPTWGQLGCQGFIVGDGRHSVVCKSTVAFMEVRDLAFRHCETLVDALLERDGAPSLPSLATIHPGARVRLHSLSMKPELNGADAIVLEAPTAASGGRCAVQLHDGRALRIKPVNCKPVNCSVLPAEDCCGGGCGACDDDQDSAANNGEGEADQADADAADPCRAAAKKLAQASQARLEAEAMHMPARMLRSLQQRETKARDELAAAQAAAAAEGVPTRLVAEAAAPPKKEAFKGGISLGTCANPLCLCADCECGVGCTCNVSDAETCEPCTEFRAQRAKAG